MAVFYDIIYGIDCGILLDMKNFHLPLPDDTYRQLKAEAQRSNIPATVVAREAIGAWLKARKKALQRHAIAAYASKMAGTEIDLDPLLERAAVELLLESQDE